MAVFIVLWPYLLTTKLRCLQKNNIGHTIMQCPDNKEKKYLPILTTLFPFNTEMPPFSFESKSCKGVNHAVFSKKRLPSVLPMDLNISSPSLTEWVLSSYQSSLKVRKFQMEFLVPLIFPKKNLISALASKMWLNQKNKRTILC